MYITAQLRKFPVELHRKLKAEAASRGLTITEVVVERLGSVPRATESRLQSPTEPGPSGNETTATIKESLHVQSLNQNDAEFLKREDRLIRSVISNINNEKLQRIAEGWNMDSRDCAECGVESGKKHLRTCVRGVRIASEAQEKMNGKQ